MVLLVSISHVNTRKVFFFKMETHLIKLLLESGVCKWGPSCAIGSSN